MKKLIIVLISIFCFVSCDNEVKKDPVEPAKAEINPLTLIPADFQFVATVDMNRTMKIPGLSERLRYEAKRKPSLQIVPIDSVKHLYLAAGSGAETEGKGGVFIAELKEKVELEKVIDEYKKKFKKDKDVIVGKKEYKSKFIYTIRDEKQELAVCQVAPDMLVSGPLDKVISSLNAEKNNISTSPLLKDLMKINAEDSVKIYLLSAENIGSILQQLKFFDQLVISGTPTEKGGKLSLKSICQNKETAEKAKNALLLVQTILMFNIGKHTAPEDLKVEVDNTVTTGIADLNAEALKSLFVKD